MKQFRLIIKHILNDTEPTGPVSGNREPLIQKVSKVEWAEECK